MKYFRFFFRNQNNKKIFCGANYYTKYSFAPRQLVELDKMLKCFENTQNELPHKYKNRDKFIDFLKTSVNMDILELGSIYVNYTYLPVPAYIECIGEGTAATQALDRLKAKNKKLKEVKIKLAEVAKDLIEEKKVLEYEINRLEKILKEED